MARIFVENKFIKMKNIKNTLLLSLLFVVFVSAQKQYQPTWESLDTRETPQWFSGAKFGIFIHWGLYSVPGYTNKGTYGSKNGTTCL